MSNHQKSIKAKTVIEGIGLHTGKHVKLGFIPKPANSGIRFIRVDLPGKPDVPADPDMVVSTNRGTTLQQGVAQVWTIEHVLSALTGLGIDNLDIEVDGPEMPIMDGSSKAFVDILLKTGIEELEAEKQFIDIKVELHFVDEQTGSEYRILPHPHYAIHAIIDFNSKVLGTQSAVLEHLDDYIKEIAPCRTFVFLHELELLLNQNLIKGGDLDNAIVIVDRMMSQSDLDELAKKLNKPSVKVEKEGVLNTIKLQFDNEPARHKLLDIIGDLTLIGRPIKGKIIATKPGHRSNVQFAKFLKKELWNQ